MAADSKKSSSDGAENEIFKVLLEILAKELVKFAEAASKTPSCTPERYERCLRHIKQMRKGGNTFKNADEWAEFLRRSSHIRKCTRAIMGNKAYARSIDWITAYAKKYRRFNAEHNILRPCRQKELRRATRGICK